MANESKKYISLARLSNFLDGIKAKYSQIGHKHTVSDISDYTVDSELSSTSTNPVQNKVLDAEFEAMATAMNILDQDIDAARKEALSQDAVVLSEAQTTAKTYFDELKSDVDAKPNMLIVTWNDGAENASHTSTEIQQHVDNGGIVCLKIVREHFEDGIILPLTKSHESSAEFSGFSGLDAYLWSYHIYADGFVEHYMTEPVSGDYVPLIVQAYNNEDNELVVSHTSQEICARYNEGYANVYLQMLDAYYNLLYCSSGTVCFGGITDNNYLALCKITDERVILSEEPLVTFSDIDGLQERVGELEKAVNGKADTSHVHAIADVTGLQDALDAKDTAIEAVRTNAANRDAAVLAEAQQSAKLYTDTVVSGKANTDHAHDDKYAEKTHDHNDDYAAKSHNHDNDYAAKTHNHNDAYYTQAQIDAKLEEMSDASHTHDNYVPTARTINSKALSADIILSASDVGALPDTTSIPDSLSDLTEDTTHRTVTDTEKNTWNAKSNFSGDYNDLTNKPTIPSVSGLATEEYVDTAIENVRVNATNRDAAVLSEAQTAAKLYTDTVAAGKANASHTHEISNVNGLQTALNAKSNAGHSHSIHEQTSMSNTDLNEIKDAGWYYGYTGMTNAPVQQISVMEVLRYSQDWVVQRFIVVNGAEYIRHWHSGNTWSEWKSNLVEAKEYADQIKNDLLNGAGTAYDTLKELGELIDENTDAIDALETVAANKADKTHTHDNYLTTADKSVIKNGDILQTTNTHGDGRKIYISKIDDAMYAFDKRYTVTANIYKSSDDSLVSTPSTAVLFDGAFENYISIPAGHYAVINISLDGWSGYPYGDFIFSHYWGGASKEIRCRVYCNYASQGIGWHDLNVVDYYSTPNNLVCKARNDYYNLTQIEVTVVAKDDDTATLSEIEWKLDRPAPKDSPVIGKHAAETLYYPLTAPSFVGSFTGNLTGTATKANQDGNGNNIASTYETKANASSKLTEAKSYADNAATTAANNVKNDLLNNINSAMTEASNQDAAILAEAQRSVDSLRAEVKRNRTHWVSRGDNIIVPTMTINGTFRKEEGYYEPEYNYNKAYVVTVDGVQYVCSPYETHDDYGSTFFTLGDSRLYEGGDDVHPEDVPFLIRAWVEDDGGSYTTFYHYWSFTFSPSGQHTVEVAEGKYNTINKNFIPNMIPAGVIHQYAGYEYIPDGYLLCDGSYYDVEEYPELFNAIGSIYGERIDGHTVFFAVPDFRGRMPVGITFDPITDASGGYMAFDPASAGGEYAHKLTADELPAHDHGAVYSGNADAANRKYAWYATTGDKIGYQVMTTGGNQAHNNMPPYLAVNYIISTGR